MTTELLQLENQAELHYYVSNTDIYDLFWPLMRQDKKTQYDRITHIPQEELVFSPDEDLSKLNSDDIAYINQIVKPAYLAHLQKLLSSRE